MPVNCLNVASVNIRAACMANKLQIAICCHKTQHEARSTNVNLTPQRQKAE